MAAYQYAALPADNSTIRLLRLLPSQIPSAKVECEIFHANLANADVVSYVALSYTWGDATKTVDITLSNSVFPATINLEAGLRALRRENEARTLWVDAICINQADLEEQGRQVQMMWSIYKAAEYVIIWLGPEEGDSAVAMADFARKETQTRLELRRKWKDAPADRKEDWCGCSAGDFETRPPRIGIQNLLRRRWFTRVWVLQEIAAAKQVFVACGSQIVPGEDFYREIIGIASFYATFHKLIRTVRHSFELIAQSGEILQKQSLPLIELIETFRSWDATKPVDKVYSLLAFSSDAYDVEDLRPDYTISEYELAKKVVHFALPTCKIVRELDPQSAAVTFEIDGFILGTLKEGVSLPVENKQVWTFARAWTIEDPKIPDSVSVSKNPAVSELFEHAWEISILNERKLRRGDIACLLRGSPRPSVLRFKDGGYTVVMLATPKPKLSKYSDKAAQPDCQKSWDKAVAMLASESEGRQSFALTWDPLRPPLEDEISRYIPCTNDRLIQWEAKLESIKDARQLELDKTGQTTTGASHNCRSMGDIWQMYHFEEENIKKGTSKLIITLHQAAVLGWVGTLKLLLDAGANVDAVDEKGTTPLLWAVAYKETKVVKALLDAKVTVDAESPEHGVHPALALAAGKGYAEICQLLLQCGARPEPANTKVPSFVYNTMVPSYLFDAVGKGHVATVKVLLAGGATPNVTCDVDWCKSLTPLHIAAKVGNVEIVKALVESGANLNAYCNSNQCQNLTPLQFAVEEDHVEIVKVLLAGGANANVTCDFDGYKDITPLHVAAEEGKLEIVKVLLEAGADVDPRTSIATTPLHHAAVNGHTELLNLLIASNADTTFPDGGE